MPAGPSPVPEPHPEPVPLSEPSEGVPEPVLDQAGLEAAARALSAGHGPVAVDAERASGFRYGQRAYLVQLHRRGCGTIIIDPVAAGQLSALATELSTLEWVLHAATQDLPCLAELGLRPRRIFDTELGARLAGYPRVGLGPLVEHVLGLSLEKGHSAADWSTRPLPASWLRYAALDVEVLPDLRDALEAELTRQGKIDWARQEFDAIVDAPLPTPRVDPWRRISGLHRVRKRRQLAAVRELWLERERQAAERDVSPSRLLPDSAIVEAALALPADTASLVELPGFIGRGARRFARHWSAAIEAARRMPESALPPLALAPEGPPPARSWPERDPAAAARLAAMRARLGERAAQLHIPVENLLAPDTVRRLAWAPPEPAEEDSLAAVLRHHRARAWQVELTVPLLLDGLRAAPRQ